MVSNDHPKVLILGVGNAQVDVIRHLSGNADVHACSYKKEGRGIALADTFEILDITDANLIRSYAEQNNIEFIYSVGSDVAMPTVASVSQALSLPAFLSAEQAEICQNKTKFREHLSGCYGAVEYRQLDASLDIFPLNYPVIVKPADSQGQRGVQKVESPSGLKSAYDEAICHSRSKTVIVEEYVKGQEISVNAFVQNGKVIFSLPSDRISFPYRGGGIIHKHLLPCTVSKQGIESVERLVNETVVALGIENGPVYFQIKMQGEKAKLIEVAPRLDGCHMWRLIKEATGVDLLSLTIDSLIKGDKTDCELNHDFDGEWVLEFFSEAPKNVFDSSLFQPHSKCIYKEFYYQNGDVVSTMNGYKEKVGYQIYRDDK